MLTWFQVGMIAQDVEAVKPFYGGIGYDDFISYVNGRDAQILMNTSDSIHYIESYYAIIGY